MEDDLRQEAKERLGSHVGPFRLVTLLGVGGMGGVYAADDGVGNRVAIKVLHKSVASLNNVRARFEDGTNVPRIPPQRLGGGLFYRDANWRARVTTLHAFRQETVSAIDPKDTPTSGYTLHNTELSYTWTRERDDGLVPEMTIGLVGNNLLDDDVRNHVSFKKDEVLQPGRTFKLFGSIKFD